MAFRQFSPYSCVGCGHGISPNDVVYKLSDDVIYHTHCHCCFQCGRPLCPGDRILVNRQCNTISCYHHFEGWFSPFIFVKNTSSCNLVFITASTMQHISEGSDCGLSTNPIGTLDTSMRTTSSSSAMMDARQQDIKDVFSSSESLMVDMYAHMDGHDAPYGWSPEVDL